MPINFPSNPTTNQNYTFNNSTWVWTGSRWEIASVATTVLSAATTNVVPATDNVYDIGSTTQRWRNLSLAGNINLGNALVTSSQTSVVLPTGSTIAGTAIATSTDVATGGGPKITNVQIADGSWVVLDDTAVDTAGGNIIITGTNFVSGCLVYFNQTPANSVAFVSTTNLRVTVPALSAGTYVLYVINPDGGTAIRVPGVTASANPAWQTASNLGDQPDGAITLSLVATEATSYTLTSGSLPPGLSLNSSTGTISGTVTGVTVDTSYTFTIRATDAQNQDSPRTFSVNIAVSDPYFKLTTLFLSGSALSANTVVRDSSTNNFNLTVFGDSRASNFTPYGTGWSVYFDGTGDYLSLGNNNPLPATGDFTFECWIYVPALPGVQAAIIANQNQSNRYMLWLSSTGSLTIQVGASFSRSTGNNVIAANRWYHIATTRTGTTHNLFVDGTAATLTTSGSSPASIDNTEFFIGINYNSSYAFTGYISNFRVVASILYTSTFTSSTSPLTAISGTSLLTCHTNRFRDDSTNNFTITRNGDARVVSFNPFNITNTGVNGSMYFDGTGDYVTTPTSQAPLALDTANFTVECWVYFSSGQPQTNPCILSSSVGSSLANTILLQFGTQPSTQIALWVNNVHLTASATNNNLVFNAWNHIAVCRTGGSTYSFFINGIAVNSVASNSTSLTANDWRLGYWFSGAHALLGYIADFRIIKGTALYSSNFTPPTAPLTAVTNTQLLTFQYDQPHNNHTFLDSSSNQFLITRSGNASQGTFSPFSPAGWSVYFIDTSSHNISAVTGAETSPGTGDFCAELWYWTSKSGNQALIGNLESATETQWVLTLITGGVIRIQGWFNTYVSGTSGPLNSWNHVAVCRSGTTMSIFVNGSRVGTATVTNNFSGTSNIRVGGPNGIDYFLGYISNARFVKGSSVYDPTQVSITVPTGPLTAITNTKFLVCQSNRLRDISSNNFTLTTSGSPQVQAFSPFAPTAVYNPAVHGGSAYFDGSGDKLSIPDNDAAFNFGSGDFTVEAWVYPVSSGVTSGRPFYNQSTGGGLSDSAIYFECVSDGVTIYVSVGSGWTYNATSGTLSLGYQWNHVAGVRSGTSLSIYVNGTRAATTTLPANWTMGNSTRIIEIGSQADAGYLNGYISGLRVIRNQALYSGTTYTIPTGPLTTTANTTCLLNFTDAAIFDSTGRNVLETVADSKTSSVITKFTGGSMYFDGTGDWIITSQPPSFYNLPGNFTIEFWIYIVSAGGTLDIMGTSNNVAYIGAGQSGWVIAWSTTTGLRFGWQTNNTWSVDGQINSTNRIVNAWAHVAVVRNGSTITGYVNGSSTGSTLTSSANLTSTLYSLYIGAGAGNQGGILTGYLSDIRITQGYARYTANFTAPTSSFRLK